MSRKHVLTWLKVAGYHNDQASFVRLYVENRVSVSVARQAFSDGARAKQAGVKCSCRDCNSITQTA